MIAWKILSGTTQRLCFEFKKKRLKDWMVTVNTRSSSQEIPQNAKQKHPAEKEERLSGLHIQISGVTEEEKRPEDKQ